LVLQYTGDIYLLINYLYML